MDLRLRVRAAVLAAAGITKCLAAALLFFAVVSQASTSRSGSDYLHPSEAQGGFLYSTVGQPQAGDSPGKAEAQMLYRAFDGQSYDLQEHRGQFVRVMLPARVDSGPFLTAEHAAEMVDRLDELYALYREILRLEPDGQGLLTIAFVPQTCGMGCGLLGAKGIEIKSDPLNYELIIAELDAGRLESILVHELVHNFDRFANYLHYLPDHAHAWTDFFQYFAAYRYGRNSFSNEAPDDLFNSPVSAAWRAYVADTGASWARCVRDSGCEDQGLSANNVWAMPYYRMENLYGTAAILQSFEFLADYVQRHPTPGDVEGKESLRLLSLAHGAGVNIACQVRSLKWALPTALASELQNRFGAADPRCDDSDNDGFIAVTGDCAEGDPTRHVHGQEAAGNGLDDDCDGIVDEERLEETGAHSDPFGSEVHSSLPFEASGTAVNLNDNDRFTFPIGGASRVRATLCAAGGFNGWAVALDAHGEFLQAGNWYTYRPGAGCSSTTFDFGDLGHGTIAVMPDTSGGQYTLSVSAAGDLPDEQSSLLSAIPRAAGGITLEVDDALGQLSDLGADELEFWVSGTDVKGSVPYAPTMRMTLSRASAPGLADGALYRARIRPKANGRPLASFSAGHLFRYHSGAAQPPQIDGTFSGAWYDPSHRGEGFVLEILEDARALAYWFTYAADGSQRWMIGVGAVDGSRIVFEEMLDSRGGRFGADFDPDDVVLKPTGSLSISFQSCTKALANFSIDNGGGSLELTRLTHVHGHRCDGGETPPENDLSGSWYDPDHSGEGFAVEQLSASEAVVYWFSYTSQGEQAWFFNTGSVDGDRITFPDLLQPVGGGFGRSYNPDNLELMPWGALELQLDCHGGSASYEAEADGFGSGTQNLVNLTRLEGSGCTP